MSKLPTDCLEHRGFSNPRLLSVACLCDGCTGALVCDGMNAMGTLGLLVCAMCGCVYTTPANKEIRR